MLQRHSRRVNLKNILKINMFFVYFSNHVFFLFSKPTQWQKAKATNLLSLIFIFSGSNSNKFRKKDIDFSRWYVFLGFFPINLRKLVIGNSTIAILIEFTKLKPFWISSLWKKETNWRHLNEDSRSLQKFN